MKKIYIYLSMVLIVLLASCTITNYPQSYTSGQQDITYQQFYDDLSPYGQWVNYNNYGYVWVPDEAGFRPYYNNGHWVYTDYGWTWVSDYSWGWAPFHYGRWTYDYAYGWMWIPGYQWAPAWVSWRSNGNYYGWAPLGPDINVNVNYGSNIPYDYWSFVPCRYITSPRLNNYYVNRQQNTTIINNTTILNNTRVINNNNRYITGPTPDDVERNTREKINAVKIVQRNRAGGTEVTGDRITMYRPGVKESPEQNQNWKPSKIGNPDEVKARHNRDNAEQPIKDDSRKELNPTDRIQPEIKNEKNNPTPREMPRRDIGQPQKPNNNQTDQPNPPNIKKDNTTPDNERLNREKDNQQRNEKNNNNSPVDKPQPKPENTDKKNDQQNTRGFQNNNDKPQPTPENTDKQNDQQNTRRFQNQNNSPQPPVQNNPPAKDRNTNQPNNNPVNKPAIKPRFNNVRPQNNNQQDQKNKPADQPGLNNPAPPIRNIKPADTKQPGQDPNQEKDKKNN